MACAKPLDLGSFDKHPSERLSVHVELAEALESRWQPGHLYRVGDVVRPGTGYAYRAPYDFTSGDREPRWTRALGTAALDGSGEWQAIVANFEGVDVINDVEIFLPFGLTLYGVVSWEGSSITIPIAEGVDGNVYECVVQASTISGQLIVGMFAVDVSSSRVR